VHLSKAFSGIAQGDQVRFRKTPKMLPNVYFVIFNGKLFFEEI
jgi:hypothetical protein